MAGDWIKMRIDLQDDPSVVAICDTTGLSEFEVIGRLHKLWGWADKHTSNGVTSGVNPKWVDRYVSHSGFSDAMIASGWLAFDDGVLSFPNFEIHNGKSAKSRCDAALRQRMSRNRHAGVTNGGDARTSIPKPFVRAVMVRDGYTCVYCGTESTPERENTKKSLLSIDHIVPHSRGGGRQAIEDLATCCKLCNNEKNDRTPEEWGVLPEFLNDGLRYVNGTIVTENCDSSVTKALPEKRREEKRRSKEKTPLPPLDVPAELQGICQDWLVYKRERREAYKPRGEASFAQQVCDLASSQGVEEVKRRLQHAMASNYQGWNFEGSGSGKASAKPVTFGQQRQQNMAEMLQRIKAQEEAAVSSGVTGFIGEARK